MKRNALSVRLFGLAFLTALAVAPWAATPAEAGVLSGIGGWAGIGLAAGLTEDTAGLGAVGAYKALNNYTQLGGVLTVFTLP